MNRASNRLPSSQRTPRRALTALAAASIAAVSMGGSACRSHEGFRKQYLSSLRPHMVKGDFDKAAQVTTESKDKLYEESDRIMYWLNLGTLQHYAGQYEASSSNLIKAEQAMQELWTTSISAEVTKYIASESVQDYPGEDFEKILVYYYTALNKLENGKLEDALVEARRADEFLRKIQVQYEKEDDEIGSLYKQDAFMLWLVGVLYEMEGSWSDAFLAYQAAQRAYEKEYLGKFGTVAPDFLREDLIRTAKLAGRTDALAKLGKGGHTVKHAANGMAELIVLHASGEAPFKKQKFIEGQMPDGYVMRIAVPEFEATEHQIRSARISVAGKAAETSVVEPIGRIALDNYKHRLPAISARAVARAAIKYAATKAGEKAAEAAGGGIAGTVAKLLGNTASAASEQADLRGWTTLPAEITATRLWVPAGEHQIEVEYLSASGERLARADTIHATLEEGERRIVSLRSFQ